MGLKLLIIVGLAILLTLTGLSGGKFLDFILPDSGIIFGALLCNLGGFIYNPVFNIGGLALPLPVADDFVVAFLIATPLTIIFLRKKSWAKIVFGFTLITAAIIVLYKMLGLLMVHYAEVIYKQTNCLEEISFAGVKIADYVWYQPLFLLGAFLAIFSIIGAFWGIRRLKNRNGGA